MAASTSSRSALPSATSAAAETNTPNVNRPRITTCSTLSSSTLWPASTSNSADVTPGLSTPVTVISTDTLGGVLTPDCRRCNALRADAYVVGSGDVAALRAVAAADMRLGTQPLHHVRIVQLKRRALRADARQFVEVVPWRWTRGGPFQGVAVAPRVVDGDRFAVAPTLEDVPGEHEHRSAEDERPDRRDDVERLKTVARQVVGVAARHALVTQPVLHQKRGVETDQGQPEVQLAQPLVEQPAGHLREPEIDPGEGGEHDGAEQHVVEVRDHEIAVGDVEVQRRAGQKHPGQPTEQKGDQKAD